MPHPILPTFLSMILATSWPALPAAVTVPPPGQVFRDTATGTLFTGKQGSGLDFNLWFDPAGPKVPRLLLSRTALPGTNLVIGADFGKGNTVYVLMQRELTAQRSEQEVIAVDRVSGTRTTLLRIGALGLQAAVGESFRYDPVTDRVVFTAAKPTRINGQVGSVNSPYAYGPLGAKTRTLIKMP